MKNKSKPRRQPKSVKPAERGERDRVARVIDAAAAKLKKRGVKVSTGPLIAHCGMRFSETHDAPLFAAETEK